MQTRETLLEYLYQALASRFGIVLIATPIETAVQALHTARRQSGDPELKALSFRKSPIAPDTELWIVKDKPRGKEGE